jgi:hypothetical protein
LTLPIRIGRSGCFASLTRVARRKPSQACPHASMVPAL